MKKLSTLFIFLLLHGLSHAQGGVWTWVKGPDVLNDPGNRGIIDVSNASNYPRGRYQAVSWIDQNGNFWIFGGNVLTSSEEMQDLWQYNPTTNIWTWVNGPAAPNGFGSYGTKGIPSPSNIPGARSWGTISWTDQNGNLWMHGGQGYDGAGTQGALDDMWMYDIAGNQWTWMQGSSLVGNAPDYGTIQVPGSTNTMGSREECNSGWVRSDGSLWAFGGSDEDNKYYDNMWKFDVTINEWTWMSGPQSTDNIGSFGTQGIEIASNLPQARSSYSHWIDPYDNLYIFGGYDSVGFEFNDVWKYNTGNNRWTWIAGSNVLNDSGHYTNYCVPGNGARPGARIENRTAQSKKCINIFWTFGGLDFYNGAFDDLWSFNAYTNQWTWVSGPDTVNSSGSYGTINVPSPTNIPPARFGECIWTDARGALWVWGGNDGNGDKYSDMWTFTFDSTCSYISKPSISVSDTVICIGDTAHITIEYGSLVSISPSTGVTLIDSAHAIISPPLPATYTFVFNSPCAANDTSVITINPVTHFSTTAQTVYICSGDTLFYNSEVISSSGVYVDSLKSRFGCDSIVTRTVFVLPAYNIQNAVTICSDESILFNGKILNQSGIYRDTLSTINGCDSNVILALVVLPVAATFLNQTICEGQSFIFKGQSISTAGLYNDTLTAANGCDSTVTLTLYVQPLSASSISQTICEGMSTTFDGHILSASGIYSDTLTTANGCDSIVMLSLQVLPRPIPSFLIRPMSDSISLDTTIFVANGSLYADSVLWLLNDHFMKLLPGGAVPIKDSGSYCISVIASSIGGCSDTSTQCIYVYRNASDAFYIPNAFTPNGDGVNDYFQMYGSRDNMIYIKISIFDRWGERVFESNDLNFQWDGTYRGVMESPSVFVYVLDLTYINGYSIHNKGSITLIR